MTEMSEIENLAHQAWMYAGNEHAEAGRKAQMVHAECVRPFMLLRPRVFPDGNQWCALYGDNLQKGVAGFGETPDAASRAFDRAWLTERSTNETDGHRNAVSYCNPFQKSGK